MVLKYLKLEEYLKTADITVFDLYLKRMCITIAAILRDNAEINMRSATNQIVIVLFSRI